MAYIGSDSSFKSDFMKGVGRIWEEDQINQGD